MAAEPDAASPVPAARASRAGIWSWMFYDWASQPFHTLIVTFVFAPYFASAVARDAAAGQEYWGYATGIAGVIIALLSPVLGALVDVSGPRKPWIAVFSAIGAIGCWMLWYAVPGMDNLAPVGLAIVLAFVGMEFAAMFNNAMMPNLVPRAELGRLSGSAWGFGYVGGLVSLVIVLGFLAANPDTGRTVLGIVPPFGLDTLSREGDRAAGPFTAVWYILFIVPMFLFTPDTPRQAPVRGAVAKALTGLWRTVRGLPGERSYFSFLLSSMFYRDALNALYAFGGIYAVGVLGWSIIEVGLFGILANITGAVGAWAGGRFDARHGPKAVVTVSVLALAACCLLVISTTRSEFLFVALPEGLAFAAVLPDIAFFGAGALIGALGGALQAASRTLLVDQVGRERSGEAFGLYALSGKATAFLGPLSVAVVTGYFSRPGLGFKPEDAQRFGIAPIILLFAIALALLPAVASSYRRET